jgi:hypothetical protein
VTAFEVTVVFDTDRSVLRVGNSKLTPEHGRDGIIPVTNERQRAKAGVPEKLYRTANISEGKGFESAVTGRPCHSLPRGADSVDVDNLDVACKSDILRRPFAVYRPRRGSMTAASMMLS